MSLGIAGEFSCGPKRAESAEMDGGQGGRDGAPPRIGERWAGGAG